MRFLILALCIICTSLKTYGQTPILPDLFGDELIEQLSLLYSPDNLLDFTEVKDTLYAVVDLADDDSVRCIYSDRAIFLPTGTDPSQALFMNGSGLNLEHIWPQSKGAGDGTDGQTDMHHLAPSRVDVNSMRANNPFEEVPDNQTDNWYYLNLSMNTVPSEMIELYSEADQLSFEPREDRKGDIARAMFYFYTIHNEDADKAFFNQQVQTLCAWHLADPVNEAELNRSERIAVYQGNMNPFLLDCTLPARAFCGMEFNCTTSSSTPSGSLSVDVSSYGCKVFVSFNAAKRMSITNRLYSVNGIEQLVSTNMVDVGSGSYSLDACGLPTGIYFLTTEVENGGPKMGFPTKQIAIF